MRSLMLALGACLFALNLAGCAGTGVCNGGGGLLCGGGKIAGNSGGCSGGCGDTACSGGSGNTGCSGGCNQSDTDIRNVNYGGKSGLGMGLMEEGPACSMIGSNSGCQSCQSNRPQFGSRVKAAMQNRSSCNSGGCNGGCQSCQANRPQLGSRMKAEWLNARPAADADVAAERIADVNQLQFKLQLL